MVGLGGLAPISGWDLGDKMGMVSRSGGWFQVRTRIWSLNCNFSVGSWSWLGFHVVVGFWTWGPGFWFLFVKDRLPLWPLFDYGLYQRSFSYLGESLAIGLHMIDHPRQFLRWIRIVKHTTDNISHGSVDFYVVFNAILHHLLSFNFIVLAFSLLYFLYFY